MNYCLLTQSFQGLCGVQGRAWVHGGIKSTSRFSSSGDVSDVSTPNDKDHDRGESFSPLAEHETPDLTVPGVELRTFTYGSALRHVRLSGMLGHRNILSFSHLLR